MPEFFFFFAYLNVPEVSDRNLYKDLKISEESSVTTSCLLVCLLRSSTSDQNQSVELCWSHIFTKTEKTWV